MNDLSSVMKEGTVIIPALSPCANEARVPPGSTIKPSVKQIIKSHMCSEENGKSRYTSVVAVLLRMGLDQIRFDDSEEWVQVDENQHQIGTTKEVRVELNRPGQTHPRLIRNETGDLIAEVRRESTTGPEMKSDREAKESQNEREYSLSDCLAWAEK